MNPLPEHAIEKLLGDAAPLLDAVAQERGKYRIVRELGRGGMGIVYEAEDTELARRVALKVLALPAGAGPDVRERFQREALAAARLNHPNIAAVYEARGDLIAMQLVDGVPMSRLPRGDRRRIAALVRDAARAVHYAHERGIVHRDLKPHNLLVEGERVVVTDFGLAKELAVDSSLSVSGHLLGTPAYMAPEQAEGRVHDVDPRTDVYGLGATLYDLLAGRPPFVERDAVRLLRRIAEDEPPRLRALAPDVPHDLETIVRKCLAKEPPRRYPTAAALADDLERWLTGAPVHAQPPSLRYRLGKFVRRRRGVLAVAGVASLLLLGSLAWSLHERGQRAASNDAIALSVQVAQVLDDARTFMRLGEVERAHERLDQGIAACTEFLERRDVATAHFLLGRLLRARNQPAAGLTELDRAIALDPALTAARAERGLLQVHELTLQLHGVAVHDVAAMDEAQRALRARALADLEAAALDHERLSLVDVEHMSAEIARLRGELEVARMHFREVLRLDPVREEARVGLSRVELAAGNDEAARALAMQALDIPRGLGAEYAARAPRDAGQAPRREQLVVTLPGVAGDLLDFAGGFSRQAAALGHRSVLRARLAAEKAGEPEAALALWTDAIADADTALQLDPGSAAALNDRAIYRIERARALTLLRRDAEAAEERTRAAADLELAHARAPDDATIRKNREALVRAQ
jgi:tetratricopeptide (TPR) repeat protein/predicted Ser/Thr protein kinase